MKNVRICPICRSADISPDLSIPAAVAFGALYSYRCNRCGFVGTVFMELPIDELPEPLEKVDKGYPVLDVTYGRGYMALLKYLAPFGILLSLVMYILHPGMLNLLSTLVFLYLTLYLFAKSYFDRYWILKVVVLVVLVLYTLFFRLV